VLESYVQSIFEGVGSAHNLPKVWGGEPSLTSSVICIYLAGIVLCRLLAHVLCSLFVIHIFPKVLMNNVIKYNMSCITVVCVSNLLIVSDSIV
jgi:hypothetical protein